MTSVSDVSSSPKGWRPRPSMVPVSGQGLGPRPVTGPIGGDGARARASMLVELSSGARPGITPMVTLRFALVFLLLSPVVLGLRMFR